MKNLLPRPLFSTYRGISFGVDGTAGYTLPALFPPPPPPFTDSPLGPLVDEEDFLTVCFFDGSVVELSLSVKA